MTSLAFDFNDRRWILTDEASQCSYGEPVLVAENGDQLRATEIAIPEQPDEIFGKRPAVYAYTVVCNRHCGETSGEDWPFSYRQAIKQLLDRYQIQWRRDGGYSPNGIDHVVMR